MNRQRLWTNLRPLLWVIFFKIITKILVDRLNPITNRIISPNQFGFIRSRQIRNFIALALEAANCLDGSSSRWNMALQVDIKKAFDTMDWDFLINVMKNFGFSNTFFSWTTTSWTQPEFLFFRMVSRRDFLVVLEESDRETRYLLYFSI